MMAIGNVLQHNQMLETLDIQRNPLHGGFAQHITEGVHHIKELCLVRCQLGQGFAVSLCDALKFNSSLIVLDISQNYLVSSDGQAIADMLECNTTLASLDVGYNLLGSEGLLAIAKGLQANQTLTSFLACSVNGHACQFLCKATESNKSLTEIDLTFNRVTVDGCHLIGEILKVNTSLKSLILAGVGLENVCAIAEGVKFNSALEALNLDFNHFGSAGAFAICESLRMNQTLARLEIASNRIGPEGCSAVARLLRVNKSIKALDLSSNHAGSSGLQDIFEALQTNATLEVLFINDNDWTSDCASALCDMVERHGSLAKIDVSYLKFGTCSQQIMESITKSQGLARFDFWGCGLEKELVSSALHRNRNLLQTGGFDDEIEAFCARNKHLRQHRVESSVLTLIALKRRLHAVPKEVFVMIAKHLMRTIEDVRVWRVPLDDN